jgi:hypothetical protein
MRDNVTTLQIQKDTKKRFSKLLAIDKKKRQARKLYNEDFLIRLLDMYEETGGNYEH